MQDLGGSCCEINGESMTPKPRIVDPLCGPAAARLVVPFLLRTIERLGGQVDKACLELGTSFRVALCPSNSKVRQV